MRQFRLRSAGLSDDDGLQVAAAGTRQIRVAVAVEIFS